jgi:hypothetical protein
LWSSLSRPKQKLKKRRWNPIHTWRRSLHRSDCPDGFRFGLGSSYQGCFGCGSGLSIM